MIAAFRTRLQSFGRDCSLPAWLRGGASPFRLRTAIKNVGCRVCQARALKVVSEVPHSQAVASIGILNECPLFESFRPNAEFFILDFKGFSTFNRLLEYSHLQSPGWVKLGSASADPPGMSTFSHNAVPTSHRGLILPMLS